MSWKDCPVECATLFNFCVNMFMYKHISNDNGILGKVRKYVIRYELQHHGFVHVHIILWVEKENLNRITNEIVVVTPTIFDGTTTKFIVSKDSLQNKLLKMVLQKQLHKCQNWCIWKGWNGNCRFGFPFVSHVEPIYVFNKETKRWEYYRPQYEDQNVVPYHSTLLLLWGAHLNILRITYF